MCQDWFNRNVMNENECPRCNNVIVTVNCHNAVEKECNNVKKLISNDAEALEKKSKL